MIILNNSRPIRRRFLTLAPLLSVLAGCASAPEAAVPPHRVAAVSPMPEPKPKPPEAAARRYEATGVASWYGGRKHQGRRTASGVRFDRNKPTAAHRSLPFGTLVEVTNLDNRRSMKLIVNDRGPYIGGRIIDVSESAARELGFHRAGLAQVQLRVIDRPIE